MFYILVNGVCTTSRSSAFLTLWLQVATSWKGTQTSRWCELTRDIPYQIMASPRRGDSGALTYFSHEMAGQWSFHRRLWVTIYASLVFFSLLTLTKQFFGVYFTFTPKFSCFSSSPSSLGVCGGHERGATWSSAAQQGYPTCPFPQQCWCAPCTLEK